MRFLSVCSGIEAASVAWLKWKAVGFSEIEPFPSAVLSHHYPDVPNLGDMTRYREWKIGAIDLLVGGTPCQSFSVAGLRKGLEDPRGNLMLVYCGILDWFKPRWFVWENVPGVLSSNGGRDFGAFLGAVAELGYGWAYRVLDAQYFGVAQRRRRVFVVGCLGNWESAAKVLFERESLSGNPAPRREAGKEVAGTFTARARSGGWGQDPNLAAGGYMRAVAPCVTNGPPFSRTGNERVEAEAMVVQPVANPLTARMHKGINSTLDEGQTPVLAQPYTLAVRGRGDSHQLEYRQDGTANALLTPNGGRAGIGVGAIAFNARQDPDSWWDRTGPLDTDGSTQAVGTDCYNGAITGDVAATLGTPCSSVNASGPTVMQPVAFAQNQRDEVRVINVAGALAAEPGMKQQTYLATQGVAFQQIADCLTSAYGTKWNGNASADNGSLFAAHGTAVAIDTYNQTEQATAHTIRSGAGMEGVPATYSAMQVRRLTPVECERLQGFPDNYTNIPWRGKPESPDGPRYKALGNSMAVPVMKWIGERIQMVQQ